MKNRLRITSICCAVFFTLSTSFSLYMTAYHFFSIQMRNRVEESIKDMLNTVKTAVGCYNNEFFSIIRIASTLPTIKSKSNSLMLKSQELFKVKDANPNIIGLNITDLQGNSYLVEGGMYNFSERDYFKNALKGQETVFGPIINKVTNIPTIFYGGPHYDDNGKLSNTFFLAAHTDFLTDLCKTVHAGVTGYPTIVKRATGLVIADQDESVVMKYNLFDEAGASGNPVIMDITNKMSKGEEGIRFFKDKGKDLIIAYTPIEGTEWSIVCKMELKEFSRYRDTLNLFVVLNVIFSAVFAGVVTALVIYLVDEKDAKDKDSRKELES